MSDRQSSMLFSPSPRKKRLQLRISERRLLLMAGDAMASVLSVFIALLVWSVVAEEPFGMAFILNRAYWFLVLPGIWLLLASASDYYELTTAASRIASLQKLILITIQMLVVYLMVFFLSSPGSLPRLFIGYYGVASFVLSFLWRMLNPALIGWASNSRQVLIVGNDPATSQIIRVLREEAHMSYSVIGIIGTPEEVGTLVENVPVIGTGGDLLNFVLRDGVSELVLSSTRLTGDIFQGVMDAYERGVMITPMPILYERVTERVPVEHMDNSWVVVLPSGGISVLNPYPFLKRIMDLVLSLVGLVIFALLLPVLALAIKLDSRGSIFYTQKRVGLNGRLYSIIKFRTMIQDAEKYTGAVFASKTDPRVTRVGRFLRKTRLDELPQLVNVLKGEMSLVGPRPERPEHVRRLQEKIPFYRTRHTIRPGVTGWAQVRYQYGADDHDAMVKLQYDLYYIRHRSLILDLIIMIRTAVKMIRMSGQ